MYRRSTIKPLSRAALMVSLGLSLSFLAISSPVVAQDFQRAPITLHAEEILPEGMLSGPNYKVNEEVQNDGLINTYQLEIEPEPVTVESTALLLTRINELEALHRMEQLKGTTVYTDALKKSGVKPLKTAASAITSPIDTTKNIVSGVGRWFGDVGRSVTSADPHQAGLVKTVIGQAPAKRQFAFEFGVNPYSSFAPLQEALDDIAWTAVGGSLTVRVAFMAIPAPAQAAVSLSGTAGGMKELVRDNSPDQLEKINADKLTAMGVSDDRASMFLNNPQFNPQEKTMLVGALATMEGVSDRSIFIKAASIVNEETVALYMRVRAQLMALYATKNPVERIVEASGVPFLRTKDGKLVSIFPLDHVRWTLNGGWTGTGHIRGYRRNVRGC